MRRILLRGAGLLCLALTCLHLALPSNLAAASSAKIIYTFAGGADGAAPESDLIADAAGNLYGTTNGGGTGCGTNGCGTVFELIRTKDGWKHQVLYRFAGAPNDGATPTAGLVFDTAGNLYGTTSQGGSSCPYSGCGTVFKLAPNSHGGWAESVLYAFTGTNGDGFDPNTDLVFDSQGNLYGTTLSGGQYITGNCGSNKFSGCGVVFRLTPNSHGTWTETVIHIFGGAPDGGVPAALVLDSDRNIYGTTAYGGTGVCNLYGGKNGPPHGCGVLYKLTPSSGGWAEAALYNFFHGRGLAKFPSGGLILEKPGRLLGTSSYGGDGDGAFFQIEQPEKGWEQTVLYRFYGNPDGTNPVGRVAMDPQGNLFGATFSGGTNGGGTVFELARGEHGWKERVLFNANSTDYSPQAGPMVDSDGHVYGTLFGSIYAGNFGAVYEIIP